MQNPASSPVLIPDNSFVPVQHDHCILCDRPELLNKAKRCEECALNEYCGTDGCPNIVHVDSEEWHDGQRRCSKCDLQGAVETSDKEQIEYWIPRVGADKTLHVVDPVYGPIPPQFYAAAGKVA